MLLYLLYVLSSLLSSAHPLSLSLSYTLAPAKNEGYWHEMPVSVKNHLNETGGATRFWRSSLRHPSNTFHETAGLTLDKFTVALWVKVDPQFWQTFRTGVFSFALVSHYTLLGF